MKKIALITGATAGIGEETARLLSNLNYNLIITGRRAEKLDLLKKEIELNSDSMVKCLSFDVRSRSKIEDALNGLDESWRNIDVLVNNAGLAAGLDTLDSGSIEDWEQMIDTNIKGLLYVSRKILPLMKERKTGHVINIGSIAGKEVYEKGNVYCATKHAVDALTKGMRIDLLPHGIKVTSVCPGAVETEFSEVRFKGDKQKAKNVYNGFTPLSAKDIAETIVFVVTRPPHVNINDILIMPLAQANSAYLNRNEKQ